MRRFFSRLLRVFSRAAVERDLDRELSAHVAMLEESFRGRGMSPEEARRAARVALGGIEQTKERHREARSFVCLEDAGRDLIYAARVLRRDPAFAVTAALSLAVGIGANSAIFSLANALVFRDPAGVSEPGRLVEIGVGRPDGGLNPASYPAYLDVRRRATTLAAVYGQELFPEAMSLGSPPTHDRDRIFVQFVTTNYFNALGVIPSSGRLFGAGDDEQPGGSPIVVLSRRFWARQYNEDQSAIGRSVRLNGQPFTVVGVAPRGFQGTGVTAPDMWAPISMIPRGDGGQSILDSRGAGWLVIGGRLKPGISAAQAAREVDALGRALDLEYPRNGDARGLRLVSASRSPGNQGTILAFLAVLMTIVTVVLAIACANVAGILLARANTRQREIAVRLAMGAARPRLVRQLLTETTLLFLAGGSAGLLLARVATSLITAQLPALPFPVSVSLVLDWRVVAFTVGLSLVAAVAFGLVPALRTASPDVSAALKENSHGSVRSRLRSVFVVAQVAFSLLLVIVSLLLVRALRYAGSTNPGFDARGVELATLDLSMGGYTDATAPDFWRTVLERVRTLPAVEAASVARVVPGGFEGIGLGGIAVPGVTLADGTRFVPVSWNIVEPGYFRTLRVPLVAGRDFTDEDVNGAQPVAIIAQAAARRFWPDATAVGRFISYRRGGRDESLLVVGVAGDVKASSLVDGLADPYVYLPLQQNYRSDLTRSMTVVARSRNGQRIAGDIRRLVASLDPNLPIVSSQTLADAAALGLFPQRVLASLAGTLGLIGLLLAAIGIYGLIAYAVAHRTREFGIRMALGARSTDVVRSVVWQGVLLTAIGAAIGLTLSAAAGQVLAGFMFGLPPVHLPTFAGAALVFGVVGGIATYVPAHRATRIDALKALRYE